VGKAALVLVKRRRADGREQGYWIGERDVRETDRVVKEKKPPTAKQAAEARIEKLKDGSSTPPDATPPPPGNGVDAPAAIDFKSAVASTAASKAQAEKWQWKGTLHPVLSEALVDMAGKLHAGMAQNPGKETLLGLGVKSVVASTKPMGNALGVYLPKGGNGQVVLAESVARNIQDALTKGEVTTHAQFQAFEVFAHEASHATSRMHQYEGINAPQSSTQGRPHSTMEEGTTEIVGQHYAASVINGFGLKMNLKDSGAFGLKAGTGAPMFEHDPSTDMPKANTPVAYHPFCRNIAAMAMVAEDAKTPEEVGNATVNWANTLKRTRGGLRYERLADRMLEPHLPRDKNDDLYNGAVEYAVNAGGALPVKNPPPFTAARQELADHLKFLMGTNKSIKVGMLRAHVKTVAAKYKGAK